MQNTKEKLLNKEKYTVGKKGEWGRREEEKRKVKGYVITPYVK